MAVPAGTPGGQVKGRPSVPSGCVANGRIRSGGKATSVPPLNGTGEPPSDTNRLAGADAFAFASASSPGEPASSVPVPSRLGTPALPGRPGPTLVHEPEPPP